MDVILLRRYNRFIIKYNNCDHIFTANIWPSSENSSKHVVKFFYIIYFSYFCPQHKIMYYPHKEDIMYKLITYTYILPCPAISAQRGKFLTSAKDGVEFESL
jgi:hypothetical protein